MILRDKDLKERILTDPSKIKDAYDWWKKSKWDKIGDSMLIDPFEPEEKLSLASYDLSVGEEYVSLREPNIIEKLKEGEAITIEPSETVLILTHEYVALPKNVMGMIVPRARWIFEGSFLNATRVDPIWYGKLLMGFTNVTKWTMSLGFKKPFCTCYFMECNPVEKHLTKKVVSFLGRTTIDPLTFSFARPRRLLRPQEFTREHLDTVVSSFGYPWDVVQCAIERGKEETIRYIEAWHVLWTDIDSVNNTIRIESSKRGKPRAFKVSNKLIMMLNALPKKSEKVFGYANLEGMRRNLWIQRKRIARKLQYPRLQRITFHTIRHWKATMEYRKTKDLLHVKEFLGHRNINSTLVYTHLINLDADEYITRITKSVEGCRRLIEAGFKYVTEHDGFEIFKKPK